MSSVLPVTAGAVRGCDSTNAIRTVVSRFCGTGARTRLARPALRSSRVLVRVRGLAGAVKNRGFPCIWPFRPSGEKPVLETALTCVFLCRTVT